MTCRVMVRSYEGWRSGHDGRGPYWERKQVWSTWDTGLTYPAALAVKGELENGGVRAAVVPEDSYPTFCATHTIC